MNASLQKAIKVFGSRTAMNIYFWLFILPPKIDFTAPWYANACSLVLFLFTIALVYLNNLLLVPRLLANEKYTAYIISILSAGFIGAYCYTYMLKYTLYTHTGITATQLTIFVSGSLTQGMSLPAILHETLGYYAILLSITVLFTMAWYVRKYYQQQKQHEVLKKKQLETELLFLKAQINPHFLFNTLNNIYGLSIEHSKYTSPSILQLSAILRYLLYESNVGKVSFEKEREVMLAYIDLELLRLPYKDNMHFSIESDGPYEIPPLLWLPVLENVFKHGTRFIGKDLMIDFNFTIHDSRLIIYSRNKYKVVQQEQQTGASGIGLNNLKQRLEAFCPGRYSINTSTDGLYYSVNVEVDLKT